MEKFSISGNVVDLVNKTITPGIVTVENGRIRSIVPSGEVTSSRYLLPGFIDAHVHIESSMLVPSEFARLAVVHGTVATVSDPHEIGNIMGIKGVEYMIKNGNQVPFHFYFGAPSCVPATAFETAGANISVSNIRELFETRQLKYLSEMMNYPGVIARDPLVMDKIAVAQEFGLPIDGHAPGLKGEEAKAYCSAGISTDHECFTLEEAVGKIEMGMKVLIREGSAAKNYLALHPLIQMYPDQVMFCSDDKHPNDLVKGHINELVKRAINEQGYDPLDVLRCACYHPIKHYNLDLGYLQVGQSADFIVIDHLHDLNVLQTYIKGILVADRGGTLIPRVKIEQVNHFNTSLKTEEAFAVQAKGGVMPIIEAIDGELVTNRVDWECTIQNGFVVPAPDQDILKLAVVNRYRDAPIALSFIKGFGLKKGAMASCIAHDSHNIIVVGTNDRDMCRAVNLLIVNKGGIGVVDEGRELIVKLPVAGIMSDQDGYVVGKDYEQLDQCVKKMGSTLKAPFMTLSFMALLVIPSLKLSDQGLFDCKHFSFVKNPDLSFLY